ncbi:MAG: hypothetical protein AAFO06_16450 [Cyanobacteria bacterium J06597_16]
MLQTEFEFTLPKGYFDGDGNLHRQGTMRLAKAMDEIVPLRDPRVKANPAYATVLILARVITQLGALESITPRVMENLYAVDLNYLYDLYRQVNELAPLTTDAPELVLSEQPIEQLVEQPAATERPVHQ